MGVFKEAPKTAPERDGAREQHTLPYSLESERAILGALLSYPDRFHMVMDQCPLKPQYFFIDTHRRIFSKILELDDEKGPIDLIAISTKLKSDKNAAEIHYDYLIDLTQATPFTENIIYYCQIVKNKFLLREIIQGCQTAITSAMHDDGEFQKIIEETEKTFLQLSKEQDNRDGLKNAREVLIPTLEELERRIAHGGQVAGITSGFHELDGYSGGWHNSDLVIMAARPGMGKTALALNWAMNALRHSPETIVAVFTLEMSKEQLMERLLSAEARLDSVKLRKGDLDDDAQDRLMEGARGLHAFGHRLVIDETPGISLAQLRARCRRYKKEHDLNLVIIDYLQLMTASDTARKQGREREIGEISMGLKALAKELSVPIIALAQLNRGPDARPDKRPRMSDLRESGSMEQDADMVLFVYRDDYYDANSEHKGKAEVIIAKNRHGETGSLHLAWLPNFVSFHNLLPEE